MEALPSLDAALLFYYLRALKFSALTFPWPISLILSIISPLIFSNFFNEIKACLSLQVNLNEIFQMSEL